MRQIEAMIVLIRHLLATGDTETEVFAPDPNSPEGIKMSEFDRLFKRGSYAEAEDLLYELETFDRRHLILAVDFYARLNRLTDAELARAHFPRDEIELGLKEALRRYGMDPRRVWSG